MFCRYEVEGRSAGALQGISSTAQSKTYPKIKIHGYQVCIHGLNLLLPDLPSSAPAASIPITISMISSRTSNIIDNDIPKYNEIDPPIEDKNALN